MSDEEKCPVLHHDHSARGSQANQHWWPNQLNLNILHQGSPAADPMDEDFDYAAEFATLDYDALKADLHALMTDSKDWWPADYGHYGPFFIRMAWHSAGTYRTHDGRGGGASGTQRFAPLNSWPDNVNLDKARLPARADQEEVRPQDLLGRPADPRGQRRARVDGLRDGRVRRRGARTSGPPRRTSTGARRPCGSTTSATAATANSWSPSVRSRWASSTSTPKVRTPTPDPVASGRDVRETFRRMAMNDEETVALVVGGHAFGKMHGAGPEDLVEAEPKGAPMEQQLIGWKNGFESGLGVHTTSSGFEGCVELHPDPVGQQLPRDPHGQRVGAHRESLGSQASGPPRALAGTVPDAHDPSLTHAPVMSTADMSHEDGPDLQRDQHSGSATIGHCSTGRSPTRGSS